MGYTVVMSLDNIVVDNLEFLLKLKPEDKCKIIDNKLVLDNDNFQDIDSANIDLVVVNTLLLSLHKECYNLSQKGVILNSIDISIDNIYENKFLSELLKNSETFDDTLHEIDDIFDKFREKYQRNKCMRNYYYLNELFNAFLKNVIIFSKKLHETNIMIKGGEYFVDAEGDNDDDESDDDSNDGDSNDGDDSDNDDNEEKKSN